MRSRTFRITSHQWVADRGKCSCRARRAFVRQTSSKPLHSPPHPSLGSYGGNGRVPYLFLRHSDPRVYLQYRDDRGQTDADSGSGARCRDPESHWYTFYPC